LPLWLLGRTDADTALDGQVAESAVVVCDESGTSLSMTAVAAHADGVHLTVDNRTTDRLGLAVRDVRGVNIPVGRSTFVLDIPPGEAGVACVSVNGDEAISFEDFVVRDPRQVWISPQLTCDGAVGVGSSDMGDPVQDPVAAARDQIDGVRAGDLFSRAGYPESTMAEYVLIVRGGNAVGVAEYERHDAKWELVGFEACPSAGLRV
jgi:hypothetical protein